MDILSSSIFTESYGSRTSQDDGCCDHNKEDRDQQTPQHVIDSLPRYTVRPKGAYSQPECYCRICYCRYNAGDKIVCLPCQHNFHDYCIENWLKWVKATCPVDRKSIIRHQYVNEINKERRARILKLDAENETQENFDEEDEEDFLLCEGENTISLDITNKTTTKKKREYKIIQENNTVRDCSQNFLSPIIVTKGLESDSKKKESMITGNTLPKHISSKKQISSSVEPPEYLEPKGINFGAVSIFSTDCTRKLQESVDEIRKSIKKKSKGVPKPEHPQKFQEALKTVVAELSTSSIRQSKVQNKRSKSGCVGHFRTISPARNERDLLVRGIIGKKTLTFGDVLNIESELSSGWIYKRDKPNILHRKF